MQYMRSIGYTYDEISDRFNCSITTVRHGITESQAYRTLPERIINIKPL